MLGEECSEPLLVDGLQVDAAYSRAVNDWGCRECVLSYVGGYYLGFGACLVAEFARVAIGRETVGEEACINPSCE